MITPDTSSCAPARVAGTGTAAAAMATSTLPRRLLIVFIDMSPSFRSLRHPVTRRGLSCDRRTGGPLVPTRSDHRRRPPPPPRKPPPPPPREKPPPPEP